MSEKKPALGQSSQPDRFRDTARLLGCDEDEAAFKEKLGVIARQKLVAKPPAATTKPTRKRRG
jgi:hypothetical protein